MAAHTDIFTSGPGADTRRLDTVLDLNRSGGMVGDDRRVYSGADITAHVTLPNRTQYKLGTLSLLAISTHRDKFPVTSLGRRGVKGFTAGHRTVGGTMVFAVLDRSIWHNLMKLYDPGRNGVIRPYLELPDNLPPFDVTVSFANEYGSLSWTGLRGVTLLDEGETYSIDEATVMETYSYMAREKIPFQPAAINDGYHRQAFNSPIDWSPLASK